MPRPRVPPENRIRAYRACDPCKASKTRCDSQLPCAACNKPSRVTHCTYSGTSASSSVAPSSAKRPARGHHQRSNSTQSQQRPLAVSGGVGLGSSYVVGSTVLSPLRHDAVSVARTQAASMMHTDRTPAEEDDPESPQEQLVTGPDGEKRESTICH